MDHIPTLTADIEIPHAVQGTWVEMTVRRKAADGKGWEQTYYNTFFTSLEVTPDNVAEIARAGRARWKIENETFNCLSCQGYHLKHNFGHGSDGLAKHGVRYSPVKQLAIQETWEWSTGLPTRIGNYVQVGLHRCISLPRQLKSDRPPRRVFPIQSVQCAQSGIQFLQKFIGLRHTRWTGPTLGPTLRSGLPRTDPFTCQGEVPANY